jgi:hypothetical protein
LGLPRKSPLGGFKALSILEVDAIKFNLAAANGATAAGGTGDENVRCLHNLNISLEWSSEDIDSRPVKNICKF